MWDSAQAQEQILLLFNPLMLLRGLGEGRGEYKEDRNGFPAPQLAPMAYPVQSKPNNTLLNPARMV